jgi:hypothetical protein
MGTTGSASDGKETQTSTYATLSRLRSITHYKETEISDSDVNLFIADADRAILRLATIEEYNEKLDGAIDGSNTLFTTKHTPIADIDFDADVDANDVVVNRVAYDDEQNPESTEVTVSSVNARDGIITLDTAPTTVNAEVGIYADYRYYKEPVDYDVLTLAANYYLAYLCEMKIRTKRIEKYNVGAVSKVPEALSAQSRWLALAHAQLPFAKASMRLV